LIKPLNDVKSFNASKTRFSPEQYRLTKVYNALIPDPSHQKLNPNTIEHHVFKANSHYYGLGIPTGGASTWDAVRKPTEHEVAHLDPVLPSFSPESEYHRAYRGVTPETASINNVLGGEVNHLVTNSPEMGKHRRENPTDPACHTNFHKPSLKEKVMGNIKVAFARATGNQDLLSNGDALRKGQVEKGGK
jgi:hypothetical protein